MSDDEAPRRGRPTNATPSRRMGGFRLPELEHEGLTWLVKEAQTQASALGGTANESTVMRKMLRDELIRKGWPKAHLLGKVQEPTAPEPRPYSPPAPPPVLDGRDPGRPPAPSRAPESKPHAAGADEPKAEEQGPTSARHAPAVEPAPVRQKRAEELSEDEVWDLAKRWNEQGTPFRKMGEIAGVDHTSISRFVARVPGRGLSEESRIKLAKAARRNLKGKA